MGKDNSIDTNHFAAKILDTRGLIKANHPRPSFLSKPDFLHSLKKGPRPVFIYFSLQEERRLRPIFLPQQDFFHFLMATACFSYKEERLPIANHPPQPILLPWIDLIHSFNGTAYLSSQEEGLPKANHPRPIFLSKQNFSTHRRATAYFSSQGRETA